jgi:hypothetical protein
MKALLSKFAKRTAVGLYVGDHEVVVSRVAATLLGPVVLSTSSESYEPDQLSNVLSRLLDFSSDRRTRSAIPVAVGIPSKRIFFSTRPIRTANDQATPQILLHEVFQSPNLNIDDMAVDLIRAQPEKRKVASIVSCRKKYLSGVLGSLEGLNVRLARVEPAPCSLLRVAAREWPTPRNARNVVRIFLGAEQGLAVAVASNLPLVWRTFDLPKGEEGVALRSIIRSLETLVVFCGVETPIDLVAFHGRPDLRDGMATADLAEDLGVRIHWSDGPGLDNASIAYGLALSASKPDDEGFDLARTSKPQARLRDLFPWREAVLHLLLLGGMALFMANEGQRVEQDCSNLQEEIDRLDRLGTMPGGELAKEQKILEERVKAVRSFLSGRVAWTAYTNDVAVRLPAGAVLTSFNGVAEVASAQGKGGKSKNSFILKATAPLAPSGAVPKEIDHFMGALRGHPLLKRDFPVVELADIRWSKPSEAGAKPIASFTVICMPLPEKVAPVAKPNAKPLGKAAS